MSRQELLDWARRCVSSFHMDRYGTDAVNMAYLESMTDQQLRDIITHHTGVEF